MAVQPQLDVAGGSSKSCVKRFFLLFLAVFLFSFPSYGQEQNPDQARLAAAQGAFDAGRWDETARLAQGPADQSAELDFLRGLALARLQKWDESKLAFASEIGRASCRERV